MNSQTNARIVARAKKQVRSRFGRTFYSSDSACIVPTVVKGQRLAGPKMAGYFHSVSFGSWKNNVRTNNFSDTKLSIFDPLQTFVPPSAHKQFMFNLWNLAVQTGLWNLTVQTGIQIKSSDQSISRVPDGRAGWATCKETLIKLMTESEFASDAEPSVDSNSPSFLPVKYSLRVLVDNMYQPSEQSSECKLDHWGTILTNQGNHHFPIQSFRIPYNTEFKLMPIDLYQIGYNVGQFKAVLKSEAADGIPSSYPVEIVQMYFGNKLDQMNAYVNLE